MSINDEELERLIEDSDGTWVDGEFRIEGAALMTLLRAVAKLEAESYTGVMAAAAVEIKEHWEAHCDAEGYGPVNLLKRLEDSIAAQYGYDADTVIKRDKVIGAQAETIKALQEANGMDAFRAGMATGLVSRLLDTQRKVWKAQKSLEVAEANFTDSAPEHRAVMAALGELDEVWKAADEFLKGVAG